jgi:hypothetical protein
MKRRAPIDQKAQPAAAGRSRKMAKAVTALAIIDPCDATLSWAGPAGSVVSVTLDSTLTRIAHEQAAAMALKGRA